MSILVVDTETSGLMTLASNRQCINPKHYKYYDTARIIEIGYAIYEKNNDGEWNTAKEVSLLVYPDGFKIDNSHIHGITQSDASVNGIQLRDALELFHNDVKSVNRLVTYNADFDFNVIMAEAYRTKSLDLVKTLKSMKVICAMKYAKKKLNVSHIKLIELYRQLIDNNAAQQHRALADVRMTAKCLFKLSEKP